MSARLCHLVVPVVSYIRSVHTLSITYLLSVVAFLMSMSCLCSRRLMIFIATRYIYVSNTVLLSVMLPDFPTSGCVFPRLSTPLRIADARDTPRSVRGEFRSLRETRTLDGFFISCARACTVASEVFTEAQSFADCKLHIRTRLLASAFSNFWKILIPMTTVQLEGL